jgi:hypothetical protein
VLKNVATWYKLWYEQFVPELKDSAVVRDCLSKILQVMSVACDEHAQKMPGNDNIPPPPPPLSSSPSEDDSSSSSRQPDFEFGHRGAENDDEAPDSELETFKDLVSYGAQKRSIGKQTCSRLSTYTRNLSVHAKGETARRQRLVHAWEANALYQPRRLFCLRRCRRLGPYFIN